MKKRILSLLLAAMMVVSIFVMPMSVSAADETTIYSWNGFKANDIRNVKADAGQVVDLGFKGEVALAPTLDGITSKGEYNVSAKIPHHTDATKYVTAYFAVKGEYLYVAINMAKTAAGTTRAGVQFDIGVAGSYSGESTWNRLGISVGADGTIAATRSPFTHEVGANAYSQTTTGVKNSDYLKEVTFLNGVYEAKFDLGQLYRLFANLPGGQEAWDTPCVNFTFWDLSTSEHYCIKHNFSTPNGRGGDWVSHTVLIPAATLDALEAKYKGVIGALGEDYRNAIPGQLLKIEDYATTTPVVDGKVSANEYTTSGMYDTQAGDINANFSVKDGYLYGAFTYKGKPVGSDGILLHFGTFAAVNSSFMLHSRAQTTLSSAAASWGKWGGSQGGMWKTAHGPADSKWHNVELGVGSGAGTAWKNLLGVYDDVSGNMTVEFQISIPSLLAILDWEGYNAEEANAVQFMFWPDAAGGTAYLDLTDKPIPATTIYQKTGYGYGLGNVLPTVELPKGCAELYHVSDVDDLGAFGQVIEEAHQSTANIDGVIGTGEYTGSHSFASSDYIDYISGKKDFKYDISQTDYYAYDDEYFYLASEVYDPYYKSGSSGYQVNISVLNKNDPYTVTQSYKKSDTETVIYKTTKNNFVDIGDAISRMSFMVTLTDDGSVLNPASKPGCVLRTQKYTSGTLASGIQSEFANKVKTFGDAGYATAGNYDKDTKVYTFEIKIPLSELKAAFGVDEIESINYYSLYKFTTPDTSKTDYAQSYSLFESDAGWQALRSLTMASWSQMGEEVTWTKTTTPYNVPQLVNVVKLVDEPLTKDGASVRISNSVSGLRFKSVYTDEYLAYMAKYAEVKGEEMEIGTLIAPKDYITGEFTHAALGAGRYVEVKADATKPFASANGVTTFAGSLVNIKEANLGRDFAGRGYIKIGNEYFYTDTYSVKSVSSIASAALLDVQPKSGNGYVHPVEGGYSPYSEGQRTILSSLIAK